jgi:predicted SprT family Zn-dependent metalloprotease
MALQLRPYELDIRVTWASMPSRDDYLAAKQRAWARDDSADSELNAVPRIRRLGERPWLAPLPAQLDTLAQRWSFFQELAASEMEWHGLTRQSWTVKYDHARARAGQCRHRAKILSFSRNLIVRGSPADMRNTLLHEIAHALAGLKHGHNRTWRDIALQIGCDGKRCHDIELAPAKWIYRCSAGCWQAKRFKRSHLNATCKMCGAACVFVRARHTQ